MELNKLQIGKNGEDLATQYLIDHGYIILERNWRHKHYEIDIIASKHKCLHIVEVKTRTSLAFGYPEESISKSKMQYLKNAASSYHYQHPHWKYLQFDVVAITLEKEHLKELFFIEDVYF